MSEAAAPRRPLTARFRDIPIRRKLLLLIMATTAAALLLSGLGITISDSILYRSSLQRDLNALAQIISDNSTAALAFEDPHSAAETLSALRARKHLVAACIYRPNGTVLAEYQRPGAGDDCPAPAAKDESVFDSEGLTVSRAILLKGRRIGTLVLLYDLGEIGERVKLYGLTVLAMLLISALVAFLISSRLSAVIATPITQLARVTTSVSETNDYSIRAKKTSGDELGVLVGGFNEMLARIQSRDDELRKALLDREEALREAQNAREFLQTTLASIGDAVISADIEGCVVFANRVARTVLRAEQEDLQRRSLDEVFRIVHESNRAKGYIPIRSMLESGSDSGSANDILLIAQDGTETPIDYRGAPIRDENGVFQGTVLVFRDVTARRRSEETSRLLSSLVESSDDAIVGHDLDGVITSWNRGAERIFGYAAAEMIGRTWSVIAPLDRSDDMPAVFERIRNGESVDQYQGVRRTKSGRVIDVAITVSPVYDALGRIAGSSKIARDITQQVRAADRLAKLNADLQQSNENLARSNEDLERFAFIASHDLQEPLRMITIYSQLLVKECGVASNDSSTKYVDTIVSGTKRMRDLLADLLAYTSIGAQNDQPAAAVDLNSVLETASKNLTFSIAETGAAVESEDLPTVIGHEAHFVPLFQNLIGNAIKYRGEAPPRIHIAVERTGSEVRFSVADNGIGIAPAYHTKIFAAFKRLHGGSIPGTGIGLAICQRVVERYGGRIWVQSELGHGATFVFTLPSRILLKEEIDG
ncbi:MAG: PAS domain S-box protein [Bryobacteraceae bacterium]